MTINIKQRLFWSWTALSALLGFLIKETVADAFIRSFEDHIAGLMGVQDASVVAVVAIYSIPLFVAWLIVRGAYQLGRGSQTEKVDSNSLPVTSQRTIDRGRELASDSMHRAAPEAVVGSDWPLRDLFHHLAPHVPLRASKKIGNAVVDDIDNRWKDVGATVLKQLSLGKLHASGRQRRKGKRLQAGPIPAEFWRDAKFTYWFLDEGHAIIEDASNDYESYSEIEVNRAEALAIWPSTRATINPIIDEHIPDVRVADRPAVLDLFKGHEVNKILPLLEAGLLTAWGRPMGSGEPPLTGIEATDWKTHYLEFLPKERQWTLNQTFLKSKRTHATKYFDVHLNRIQIEKIWPGITEEIKSSRITIHDFLYTEAPKVGWKRNSPDENSDLMTLLVRLRQAASDGRVHIWGKQNRYPASGKIFLESTPLVAISSKYWEEHEIDAVTAIFNESNSDIYSQREFDTESHKEERYYDLHLSKQGLTEWLNSEGRP